MILSDVAKVEELSYQEFTHLADSSTSVFPPLFSSDSGSLAATTNTVLGNTNLRFKTEYQYRFVTPIFEILSWIVEALSLYILYSVTGPSGGQKKDGETKELEWDAMISQNNNDLIMLVIGGPQSLLAAL